jgi:ACS family glucarate transporter-like MFS transporter
MLILRQPVRIRWWIFLYMCAFAVLSNVQRTSIGIAAERIEPELHFSQMQIGWMMWAFTVMYMIMQAPGGVFGQRYGARITFFLIGLVGFVATAATPLAPVLLTGIALFLAMVSFQGLLGVSQAPVFPTFAGVCEVWFPAGQWAMANGVLSSAQTLGTALTPPLIVLLTQEFGWQIALLWISLPAAALALLWLWYGRNSPREHKSVTAEELGELGELNLTSAPPVNWKRLGRIAADRNILLLTISYACMNYVYYLLTSWTFLYLVQERHLSALQGGFLATLPPIGAAVGAAVGGFATDWLATRFGARRGYGFVPLAFLPLAGVLLLAAVYAPGPLLAVAALICSFFATEITEGPYWAATMCSARADTMAATGVLNTGGNLGGVIGIPIVAYLSGHQAWNAAFTTGVAFALVAAGLWFFVDPTRGHHGNNPNNGGVRALNRSV